MKRFLATAVLTGLIGLIFASSPSSAKAYTEEDYNYDLAWDFVCDWECGEAMFAEEYGGYTLHGYASVYHSELPDTEREAFTWAYYDFWQPAGCNAFSTHFSQTVCLDTAFLHGVEGWQEMASVYQSESDDALACSVVDDRAYLHDDGSYYSTGWLNRDAALAELGGCW